MSNKHQTLMTKAYKKWTDGLSYRDFLLALDVTERRAVTLGNLNYQVENGGFMQWADNRYIQGLDFLRDALKAVGTETAEKTLKIVNEAAATFERNEARLRRWVGDDDDEEIFERLNTFDEAFYAINTELMKDCEAFFKTKKAS